MYLARTRSMSNFPDTFISCKFGEVQEVDTVPGEKKTTCL